MKIQKYNLIVVPLLLLFLQPISAQSALENLATVKQGVKSMRVSSFDRSGGNNTDRIKTHGGMN